MRTGKANYSNGRCGSSCGESEYCIGWGGKVASRREVKAAGGETWERERAVSC